MKMVHFDKNVKNSFIVKKLPFDKEIWYFFFEKKGTLW